MFSIVVVHFLFNRIFFSSFSSSSSSDSFQLKNNQTRLYSILFSSLKICLKTIELKRKGIFYIFHCFLLIFIKVKHFDLKKFFSFLFFLSLLFFFFVSFHLFEFALFVTFLFQVQFDFFKEKKIIHRQLKTKRFSSCCLIEKEKASSVVDDLFFLNKLWFS